MGTIVIIVISEGKLSTKECVGRVADTLSCVHIGYDGKGLPSVCIGG